MKLKSKQEEIFEVEKEVACRSVTVKNMVEDTGLDTPVPLPMVDSKILIKVRPWCPQAPSPPARIVSHYCMARLSHSRREHAPDARPPAVCLG